MNGWETKMQWTLLKIYASVCVCVCCVLTFLDEMTMANQRYLLACFLIIKYVSIQFTASSEATGQNEKLPALFTMPSNVWPKPTRSIDHTPKCWQHKQSGRTNMTLLLSTPMMTEMMMMLKVLMMIWGGFVVGTSSEPSQLRWISVCESNHFIFACIFDTWRVTNQENERTGNSLCIAQ